jgi:hypothetical protein
VPSPVVNAAGLGRVVDKYLAFQDPRSHVWLASVYGLKQGNPS